MKKQQTKEIQEAQFQLGQMYEEEEEWKKMKRKQAELYEKAANQGNQYAQSKLGKMYLKKEEE